MTVKEMHIDIADQVQHLSANRNRKFSPDQIDWVLNRTQQGIIESSLVSMPGSGRYQVKPDKHAIISSLIVNRKFLPAGWNGTQYVSQLSPDFWYLLDDGSKLAQLCKGDTKTTTYEVLQITWVPFPLSTASSEYYKNTELLYNNSSILNINTLIQQRQLTWGGLPQKDAHFYVRTLLMEELAKMGIDVYWEKFDTMEYPYHLVFVSRSTAVPIELKLDGVSYTGTTQELTREIHQASRQSVISPNTMISQDKELSSSSTPYFKTSYISPLSTQGPGVIYTQADDSFIVYGTFINYVRKPQMISLSLGTNCSLSPDIHQKLCNETAVAILNRISDPAWKEVMQQNLITSQ